MDGLIRGIGRFCVAVAVKVSEMVSPWIERTEADATLTPFDCSLGFSWPNRERHFQYIGEGRRPGGRHLCRVRRNQQNDRTAMLTKANLPQRRPKKLADSLRPLMFVSLVRTSLRRSHPTRDAPRAHTPPDRRRGRSPPSQVLRADTFASSRRSWKHFA